MFWSIISGIVILLVSFAGLVCCGCAMYLFVAYACMKTEQLLKQWELTKDRKKE